jgi:hypothetical protein
MAAKKSRPTSTKFAREAKLRERRAAKEARRDARKLPPEELPASPETEDSTEPGVEGPPAEPLTP